MPSISSLASGTQLKHNKCYGSKWLKLPRAEPWRVKHTELIDGRILFEFKNVFLPYHAILL